MKKKVLFMVINMNVGGVEKALLSQLSTMSPEKYEIKVLMLEKYGEFLDKIPSWVEIEYLNYYKKIKDIFNNPPKSLLRKYLKEFQILKLIYYIGIFSICKFQKNREFLLGRLFYKCEDYKGHYDEAIAYAGPMSLIDYFIIRKVKADKKISWIHFDVSKISLDVNLIDKLYPEYDEIRVVSEEAKKKFNEIFPKLENKTKTTYNVILKDEILKLGEESGFNDGYKGLKFLTVGRISKEKGQDLAIEAFKKFLDSGKDGRLYFIGDGAFRSYCQELVKKLDISEKVIFLGTKINPYPYMKECDIYIQPSRYEACCTTISEAIIFNKTIVSTKFTGVFEKLVNIQNSFIVDFSSDDIYKGMNDALKILEK